MRGYIATEQRLLLESGAHVEIVGLAVDAAHAKSFLSAHGIRVQEDDRPQMSGTASRAHRAASISACTMAARTSAGAGGYSRHRSFGAHAAGNQL